MTVMLPNEAPSAGKLYADVGNLKLTIASFTHTQFDVWKFMKKRQIPLTRILHTYGPPFQTREYGSLGIVVASIQAC